MRTIDTKNLWIIATIAVVWVVVLITSNGSEPLTWFSQDEAGRIIRNDPTEVGVSALINWFWGLVATVMILRSTLFRRPNELGYGETTAWPWMTLVVAGIWVAAGVVALNTPAVGFASDRIIIPIGAILAIPVATGLTSYAVEFLIQGFAARNAGVANRT